MMTMMMMELCAAVTLLAVALPAGAATLVATSASGTWRRRAQTFGLPAGMFMGYGIFVPFVEHAPGDQFGPERSPISFAVVLLCVTLAVPAVAGLCAGRAADLVRRFATAGTSAARSTMRSSTSTGPSVSVSSPDARRRAGR